MKIRMDIKKDMWSKEIGLCAQNMITIPTSIANIIGGDLHDHLMSMRINYTFTMNDIFIQAPIIVKKVATNSIWIC
jgi:hypothetical protein